MFFPPFGENGGGPVSGERKEEKRPSGSTRVNLAPAVSLIQRLVTEELCEEVFRDVRTKERRRKLSLHGLFYFWTSVVLRAPRALRLAFEQARVQADPMVPRLTAAMGSFFDRCQSLDYSFFLTLYHRFVELVEKETRGRFGSCVGHLRDVFTTILIIDGSNCDKIAHRLKALRKVRAAVLPGCLTAVYDLFRGFATRLYFWPDAARSEFKRAVELIETLPAGALLLGDRLYCSIELFHCLKAQECFGLFRLNKTIKYRKVRRLSRKEINGGLFEDFLVAIGAGADALEVRLIRLKLASKTYAALTNVLDPTKLSAEDAARLYPLRWQVERLFYALKVVLNLKNFYASHPNAVAMQIFAAAAVHVAFRAAQGLTAEKLGVVPEEISTEKLFPRLALTAYALAMREVLHEEYQRQNPGMRIKRPPTSRFGFMQTRLSEILLEHRSGKRKKRRFCASRRTWKSLAHITGARHLVE
jgi:hypothetical protein